jgi:cytoplasmic tRNA 2-thiolation protein 2
LQTTKFKRSIEPSINPASASTPGPRRTKLKATGNLTIGFSGGLGSTVLLDLVSRCYFSSSESADCTDGDPKPKGGTKHPRNENVWKEARACYVEMCGAFPDSGVRSIDLY